MISVWPSHPSIAPISRLHGTNPASTSAVWETIDYADLDDLRRSRWRGESEVVARSAGTVNTVALWFDATLVDGIAYSSEPGDSYTTYGQFTLPLIEPLTLAAGETVKVMVAFHRLEAGNVWRWSVDTATEHREGDSLAAIPLPLAALSR